MSRTYRKSSITDEMSLAKYTKKNKRHNIRRSFYYKRVLTDAGKTAFIKAVKQYDEDCSINACYSLEVPYEYQFCKQVVVYCEIEDYTAVIEKDYHKSTRDGYVYDSNRNKGYKKYCVQELRNKNKILATKVIKEDDSWEFTSYPDTYMGKKHIWSFW